MTWLFVWLLALDASAAEPFYDSMNLARRGNPALAAERLAALGSGAQSDFADDALLEAARLYEEDLGDPARALALYQDLLARFPHSRLSRRAEARAQALERALGPEGRWSEAASALQDLTRELTVVSPEASLSRLKTLLELYPGSPQAPEAMYWIGHLHAQTGNAEEALATWRELGEKFEDSEWSRKALGGQAELHLSREDFDEARAAFARLTRSEQPAYRRMGTDGLEEVDGARTRARVRTAAWFVVTLVFLGLVVRARVLTKSVRQTFVLLRRPPTEVLFLLPLIVLLLLASATNNRLLGLATERILVVGFFATWLSGRVLDASRGTKHHRAWAVAQAAAVALAVVSACYIAVARENLIEVIVETWRFGPDDV